MMKKLVLLLCLSLMMSSAFAVEGISVNFDGDELVFDVAPEIINGRTMVPIGTIFNALEMTVKWDGELRKVTANKSGLEVILFIDSDQATVNGKTVVLDAAAYIRDGRTMVPLRFVAESTGAIVSWNGDTRTVDIMTDTLTYKIVDTGVTRFYTDKTEVSSISKGAAYYGQDAHYEGYQPNYQDNGDGTVTDEVTGLMWQKTMDEKMTYDEAVSYANTSKLAGYDDWRLPTIKELFSLILFNGESGGESAKILYIDTDYFDQPIGNTAIGEREIDAQTWSATKYVGTTMNGDETVFGVNFIDGRIKGYGMVKKKEGEVNKGYFRLVRGNTSYGKNQFIDNGDGTITDLATGLMWQAKDDGTTRDWEEALSYAENLNLSGYDDWRLPNVKELQSIVDYTRSVQTTGTAAIDPLFTLTEFKDTNGDDNYGFYWSSTTHRDGMNVSDSASYVAFGEALGEMFGNVIDVHGCGAVRSDPKSGSENSYPKYFGPQGDIQYVYNYVLSVRSIDN